MRAIVKYLFFIFISVQSFPIPFKTYNAQNLATMKTAIALPEPPSDYKSRVQVRLSGPSLNSAIFRAELKKELTFFRGCSGKYKPDKFHVVNTKGSSTQMAKLVAEGKTKQLARFLEWCQDMGKDLIDRKPSFQGPPLIVNIEEVVWSSYIGDIEGFSADEEAPVIGAVPTDASVIEAQNMAGTDESV